MKLITYTVSGSGTFPVDMLRYTQSFPASEADSSTMAESGRRIVKLQSYSSKKGIEFSKERWTSFCWELSPPGNPIW